MPPRPTAKPQYFEKSTGQDKNIDERIFRLKLGSEGYRMGGIDSSTGLTLKLIESIVDNFEFVKSAEEMVKTFEIWDIEQANSLLKIITEVCLN